MALRPKARRFTRRPVQTQARVLRRLLRRAADTEWGRRFAFGQLARQPDVVAAFQARVPLHTYEDVKGDIARIRQGEADILWPGTVKHFAVSSGTVSAGKILPLSRETMRRNLVFSFGVGLQYVWSSGNVRTLWGQRLTMGGQVLRDETYPGNLVGEVSGFLAEAVPPKLRFLHRGMAPEITAIRDWPKRMSATVDFALGRDIRVFVGVPPWAIVLFKLAIERHNERHDTRVRTVGEIWPNLGVFVSGGTALSSYRDLLVDLIGLPNLHYMEAYGASEGFFAYQATPDDDDMLLDLDCDIFYEFIRLEELGDASARRYTIEQVESGVRYVPYVSTCSGLWAYLVGDVIRFTSISPHKIVVAGRTAEMLDRYGQAVFAEEARETIERASRHCGAFVAEYHLTCRPPSAERPAYLEWLIEFASAPGDLDGFRDNLESVLCDLNRHYQNRRDSGSFDVAEVRLLSPGTFAAWLKSSRSYVSAQTKVPRLSEDTAPADALLAISQERRS